MSNPKRHSPLALAILALLFEEPMHPYRMQQLIRERGKDEVINVRSRNSLYQAIAGLLRAKLIAVRETSRDERWPERTVYELTDKGRQAGVTWLREMLSTPASEFPEFPAALAYLPMLTPEDARLQLEWRVHLLEQELLRIDTELNKVQESIPRLFLIEGEYVRLTIQTELDWVKALIEDLRSGRLTWSHEWMRSVADQLEPPEPKTGD
jgi:DNA-binding PadR family transcriptional regulator